MKHIFILFSLSIITLCTSCKEPSKEVKKEPSKISPFSPKEAENAVIYEANIRQYSPEGTFNAFTKNIPTLKELGVKILWVMPIQPISIKKRKATGDTFIEDIKDPKEREKYLGSYYAISDYTAIHPDYGSLEDFKNLVKTAHDNGIYVILDWVANHTGWDHKWITDHPEYYHKNKDGEITDPLNPETGKSEGWDDVAHLNFDNANLFEVMKDEMAYWIKEADIDGFRTDAADRVNLDFWTYANSELQEIKPLFMLMEADNPRYLKTAFDMGYNWKIHHLMNEIAQGKKTVKDLDSLIEYTHKTYQKEDILMNFTSNHDENSWAGTVFDRFGDEKAVEAFAALTYTLPGMPLIYNGQEYDSHRQLLFFEKDSIDKKAGNMFDIYKKLGKLKSENPALNGGIHKASYNRLKTNNNKDFIVFSREKDDHEIVFIANLSPSKQQVKLPVEGAYLDYIKNKTIEITKDSLQFKAWEYKILVKK